MDGRSLLGWDALKKNIRMSQPRRITSEEVAKHCSIEDAWIILFGKIYDITQFAHFHPGGLEPLMDYFGKDGTEAFGNYFC